MSSCTKWVIKSMQLARSVGQFFAQRPWSVYVLTCVLSVLLVCSRAYQWNQAITAFDKALQPKWSPPPAKDASQRFFLDNDSYYWITYARQMVQTGDWRIRYTYADNVPYGREVHWSQSVMWLLVGFGYVRHLMTGEAMFAAIEGASIWVNPFLLVFFMVAFSWLISRRMGVVAGVFFALTFVTLPDIGWAFHPFRPGHHGLHLALSLGTVLCLVLGGLGWVRRPQVERSDGDPCGALKFFRPLQLLDVVAARRYFAAAGVFTGFGLWIGATVQCFTIGALAVGSMLLAVLMPANLTSEDGDYVPELWRAWGKWASVVGLVFYLIEYFPSHMATRLEVNNPLYILAIFCIGEWMVQLTRWRSGGWRADFLGGLKLAALAGGMVLVPVLFLFGPTSWHNMRDVQMSRLHNFITEFYTYLNFHSEQPLKNWFFKYYGILPFFLLGALALTGPRRTRLYEWAGLWVSFFLCVFSLLLTLWEVRFSELHAAMSIWLMIVVGHIVWRNVLSMPRGNRPVGPAVLLSSLVLAQAVYFAACEFSELSDIRQGKAVKKELVDAAMKKHLAEGLKAESRGRPLRVICSPDDAPALYYFAGLATVESFYWENPQGLHDATAFFADRGDAVARRIAKERGLTHVLVSWNDPWPARFNYIETGDRSSAEAPSTLMARLTRSHRELPPWIAVDESLTLIGERGFDLRTPRGPASLQSQVTVYRLDPTSTEEQNRGK